MGNDDYVSLVITTLTVAASLALIVERVLEVFKHFRDEDNAKIDKEQVDLKASDSAEKTRHLIKELEGLVDEFKETENLGEAQKADARQKVLKKVKSAVPRASAVPSAKAALNASGVEPKDALFERHSSITIIPLAAKSVGKAQSALVLTLIGAGLGIIMAEIFNVKLVSLFLNNLQVPHWADILLTGLVIGGGSQPIHVLIRFLTTRKVPEMDEGEEAVSMEEVKLQQAAVPKPETAVVKNDNTYWVSIEYHGGVKPETLEHRHLRTAEPDLIVYHHTAMSSNIPFKGVVDEFLVNKGWSTGYNCVIMPDGAIKPFCRWDRYGNHALNLNPRSLGVAFHGNFHTLANDKYSNHDGRFGNQRPTPAQLDAGARLVALWVHLYPGILLNFNSDILPHRTALPGHTVCPGSNFPDDEFKKKVSFYVEKWESSDEAKKQIELFKQKPYIYANV